VVLSLHDETHAHLQRSDRQDRQEAPGAGLRPAAAGPDDPDPRAASADRTAAAGSGHRAARAVGVRFDTDLVDATAIEIANLGETLGQRPAIVLNRRDDGSMHGVDGKHVMAALKLRGELDTVPLIPLADLQHATDEDDDVDDDDADDDAEPVRLIAVVVEGFTPAEEARLHVLLNTTYQRPGGDPLSPEDVERAEEFIRSCLRAG
jgi:hypothetical protein